MIVGNFISIPLLLKLLGVHDYGVWVTMTSMISWYLIFDLGIGNAIRNRVAEASTSDDVHYPKLQDMLAGSIQIYFVVAVALGIATLFGIVFVEPLKSHVAESSILYGVALAVFPLSISTAVLQGEGSFLWLSALTLVVPVGWTLFNLAALSFGSISLLTASLVYSLLLLIQSAAISHRALHRHVSLSAIFDLSNARRASAVVKAGVRFFALQISSLILFYAGNFISFQNLDASEVGRFDTLNKIFMVFSTILNIATSVTWTEIAKAKSLNDRKTMTTLFHKMLIFSAGISIASIMASGVIRFLIRFVSHGQLMAAFSDAWPFALLITVQAFSFTGAVFLNAHEKVNGQLAFALLAVPVFIICSTGAFHFGLGITSVPLSTVVAILPSMFYCLASGYKLAST